MELQTGPLTTGAVREAHPWPGAQLLTLSLGMTWGTELVDRLVAGAAPASSLPSVMIQTELVA